MIQPSLFLRRALLADAIVSGVSAAAADLRRRTAGAAAQPARAAPARNRPVPDRLCGAGRLARHTAIDAEGAGADRDCRQCGLDAGSIALLFSGCGQSEPARRDCGRSAGDRGRRVCRAAIYRLAQERRRGDGLSAIRTPPQGHSASRRRFRSAHHHGRDHPHQHQHDSADQHRHQTAARERIRRLLDQRGIVDDPDRYLRALGSSDLSCLLPSKPVADTEHDALRTGDAEFEAGGDAPRQLDEMGGGCRRTDLAGGRPRTAASQRSK